MRLLIECPQCGRQYDATGKAVGGRFRCHCGEAVTVQQPHGRDAAVVRCSSCGAPRIEGSRNCRFCEADFTLHERDLHTVCPRCLARVSDRASFCHHCGVHLVPEMVAGDDTPLNCPACGQPYRLTSRRIGEVAVLECDRCAGFWLGNNAFDRLTERAAADTLGTDAYFKPRPQCATPPPLPEGPLPPELSEDATSAASGRTWRYRRCVRCDQLMHRHHYGKDSGVIVDVCKAHGVWFDSDELARILAYIRRGGESEAKSESAVNAAHAEAAGGPPPRPATSRASLHDGDQPRSEGSFLDLFGDFFHVLFGG